jgi:hypothetical protein
MGRALRAERYHRWLVEGRPEWGWEPRPDYAWVSGWITEALPYLDYEETVAWYVGPIAAMWPPAAKALLACNDRYYLLTELLGRVDLHHQWLFDRCREVEAEPDGHIDLWARFHGKSSIVTLGGGIQEILSQIKNEFETNETLKELFRDVLYENPRGKNKDGERPAKWGVARGITVKRLGRPKEATIEAHGLIDGQPTGRHFNLHIYDDVVTQDYLTDEQLKKTTARFEMADNLGTRQGVRKWIVGTRYHFADVYGVILDRGSAKPRIYPATLDGTLNGQLVLLEPKHWEKIKRDQGLKTVTAQMLLNPLAGNEATFLSLWLRFYEIIPRVMNVYILVDPSKGTGERSDRTAISVIGIDPANNKYLLDGYCHRMKLTERLRLVEILKAYWENFAGVQMVKVGWERYGKDVEVEVITDMLRARDNLFTINELNTPRQGGHSKDDRIERLEPDIRGGRFFLPCVVHHPEFSVKVGEFAGSCYWSVWTDEDAKNLEKLGHRPSYHVGQIIFRAVKGLTKLQREYGDQRRRIVIPLKRKDENGDIYDLTRVFMDEMVRHPFATHDDFIDATSRIYDIEPLAPAAHEAGQSTEGSDVEDHGILEGSTGAFEDD